MNNSQQDQGNFCSFCQKRVSNYELHVIQCQKQNRQAQQNLQNNMSSNSNKPQQSQDAFMKQSPSKNRDTQYSYQANEVISDNLRDVNNRNMFGQQNVQQQSNQSQRQGNSGQFNNEYDPQNLNYQRNNGNMSYYHPLEQSQDETVKCPNCDTILTIEMVSIHVETCPNKEIQCQFCRQLFPQCIMNDHLDVCDQALNQQQQQSQLRRNGNFSSNNNRNQNRQPIFQQQHSRNDNNNQRQQQRQNSYQNQEEQEMSFQRQGSSNPLQAERVHPLELLFLGLRGNRSNRRQGIGSDLFQILIPLMQQSQNRQFQYFLSHGNMEGFDYSNDGGLNENQLKDFPVHKFQKKPGMSQDLLNCPVCLCEFEEGEEVKILDCCHSYHSNCIDEWLKKNTHCPVCKQDMKQFV
ncbi:C3HC4 type (RING finger) zinc finger protein (macronuclear) [Tetrahymena thermophila SB210]|uniref:C3HC4 type (RING finger) zinc finger protein n=1 Tax=Tetrahymena thermophila (strain SB210) TaxID=312017 RepID=I7M2N0_TETTS|nr:C3HC4 type (RING finger) zinc finger protein [Tetrahymena thermophila SB210]EAS00853.3 C3HC4 type (RING finger) zinc finger protein [Tetrahymena thermophila SB210]|eukprot:XP_001021098.3 C3HC4 type (RING finger) zinc finger protein [Tetrahymena thermophila SB210]